MTMLRALCLCAAAILAGGVFAPAAHSQDCGGYGWGGGWPYNFQSGIYGRTNAYTLPYFSLHPPVYYSYVVPRPYGYSPFAVPPGVEPAEMRVVPAAQEMKNPHFKPKKSDEPEAKKTSDQTTQHSREIANPYFQPDMRFARSSAR